jgi:hypothetical protein
MSTLVWLFEWWLVFVAFALPFGLLLILFMSIGSSPVWHGVELRSREEIRQAALNLKTRTVFWWI